MKVEPTEILELDVEKVSGVESPANGTKFLVLKATGAETVEEPAEKAADDTKTCPTCKGSGTILEGNRKCPDCGGDGKVPADFEKSEEITPEHEALEKAKLSTAELNDLPDSSFAYIEPGGDKDDEGKTTPRSNRHFAIHDKTHADNAAARIAQGAEFGDKALPKVKAAQAKFGEKAEKDAAGPGVIAGSEHVGEPTAVVTDVSGAIKPTTTTVTPNEPGVAVAGGVVPFTIPAEALQDQTKPAVETGVSKTAESVAYATAAFAEHITQLAEIQELRERATKAGLALTPPSPEQDAVPGDMPWESYDSATLAQIATCLAQCSQALDCAMAREQTEAATNDPGDIQDVWDIQDAQAALDYALGIAARLSFSEQAEALKADTVEKVGRRLSTKTESSLRAARDHLTSVIGDGDDDEESGAGDGQNSDQETIKMDDVTKTELAELISAGIVAGLAAKDAPNNGGEVQDSDIKPSDELGDDLAVSGSTTDEPGVTKQADDESEVAKQLKTLSEAQAAQSAALEQVGELVTKMARRPASGGPHLTGVAPAVEGRHSGEAVQKSSTDEEIEQLQKSLQEATTDQDRDHYRFQIARTLLANQHRNEGVAA